MDQNSTGVSYIALLSISRALLAFGSNSSRGEQAPRKTSLCLSFCVAEKVPNMTEGASINEHHDGKGVLVLWMVRARLEAFIFTGHLFQLFSIFSRTTVCTSESSCGIFGSPKVLVPGASSFCSKFCTFTICNGRTYATLVGTGCSSRSTSRST